jgi:hypothetical protein
VLAKLRRWSRVLATDTLPPLGFGSTNREDTGSMVRLPAMMPSG